MLAQDITVAPTFEKGYGHTVAAPDGFLVASLNAIIDASFPQQTLTIDEEQVEIARVGGIGEIIGAPCRQCLAVYLVKPITGSTRQQTSIPGKRQRSDTRQKAVRKKNGGKANAIIAHARGDISHFIAAKGKAGTSVMKQSMCRTHPQRAVGIREYGSHNGGPLTAVKSLVRGKVVAVETVEATFCANPNEALVVLSDRSD